MGLCAWQTIPPPADSSPHDGSDDLSAQIETTESCGLNTTLLETVARGIVQCPQAWSSGRPLLSHLSCLQP